MAQKKLLPLTKIHWLLPLTKQNLTKKNLEDWAPRTNVTLEDILLGGKTSENRYPEDLTPGVG